jgi:hypothetical protein
MRALNGLGGVFVFLSGCSQTVTHIRVRDPAAVAMHVSTPEGRFEVLPPGRTPEARRLLNSVVTAGPYGDDRLPLAIDAQRGPDGAIAEVALTPAPVGDQPLTLLSKDGEITLPFDVSGGVPSSPDGMVHVPVCSVLRPVSTRQRSYSPLRGYLSYWNLWYAQVLTPACSMERGLFVPELVTPLANLESVTVERLPPPRVQGAVMLPLGALVTAAGGLLLNFGRAPRPGQAPLFVGVAVLAAGLTVDVTALYVLFAPHTHRRVY